MRVKAGDIGKIDRYAAIFFCRPLFLFQPPINKSDGVRHQYRRNTVCGYP